MTAENAEKLLPCPFCGGTGLDFREGSTFRWLVYSCKSCGVGAEVRVQTLGDGTPTQWRAQAELDAIAEWNHRVHLSVIDAARQMPDSARVRAELTNVKADSRKVESAMNASQDSAKVCPAAHLSPPQPSERNAVIEECAKVCENVYGGKAHTYASENADTYRTQDGTIKSCAKAIRSLVRSQFSEPAALQIANPDNWPSGKPAPSVPEFTQSGHRVKDWDVPPEERGETPDIEAGRNVAWLQRFACEPSLSEVERDSLIVAAGVLASRAEDVRSLERQRDAALEDLAGRKVEIEMLYESAEQPQAQNEVLRKDAERFRYLQNLDAKDAQAFFWNYQSRKQRAAAIDAALRGAGKHD